MFSSDAVDALGVARDLADRVVGELEVDVLRREERVVLLQERVLGLREDADEVLLGQGVELDADRKAALELRDQVRGLGDVERAGGDEEDVVGLHEPVLGVDGRAFDDRQEVALDALARDVRAAPPDSRPATLSISSKKTMPDDCARSTASRATTLGSTSRPSSSAWRISRASATRRLAALLLAAEEARAASP